jgi:membrane protease subunit (stomatin/prohibitin family)
MARTAVVAGTATAVAGGVQRRQADRADAAAQEQNEDLQAQQAQAAPPAPAAAPAGNDLMAELQKLGEMRTAGLLDDAEFAAAKAKLLA